MLTAKQLKKQMADTLKFFEDQIKYYEGEIKKNDRINSNHRKTIDALRDITIEMQRRMA